MGKQRTLSFGAWPEVGLADARRRPDDARRQIAAGLDPSHEIKLAAARAMITEENSFKLVAEEWSPRTSGRGMADFAALHKDTCGREEPVTELVPAMLTAFLESDRVFEGGPQV